MVIYIGGGNTRNSRCHIFPLNFSATDQSHLCSTSCFMFVLITIFTCCCCCCRTWAAFAANSSATNTTAWQSVSLRHWKGLFALPYAEWSTLHHLLAGQQFNRHNSPFTLNLFQCLIVRKCVQLAGFYVTMAHCHRHGSSNNNTLPRNCSVESVRRCAQCKNKVRRWRQMMRTRACSIIAAPFLFFAQSYPFRHFFNTSLPLLLSVYCSVHCRCSH